MADEKNGKHRLNEGYEPLQKGYKPKEQHGYSPMAQKQPLKAPKGGSGLVRPATSYKK
jgi:hypothetical protein